MREKHSVIRRVADRFGAPLSDMTVLYGDRSASVRGCRGVLYYSPERVRLAVRGKRIEICGRDLRCVSFAGGSVRVEGTVCSVAFLAGESEP